MSNLPKSKSSGNVTSLQESESGLMRFELPDGTMTDPYGRDHVPVNLSAWQAKEMDFLTSGTYGRTGFISSKCADLSKFLVSKLQVRTDLLGSTLFKLTWKKRDTPTQHWIYALRASVRRISVKDCGSTRKGSWVTPNARDWKDTAGMNFTRKDGKQRYDQVSRQVFLTHWPTVTTIDNNQVRGEGAAKTHKKRSTTLGGAARLTHLPTPRANEYKAAHVPPNRQGGKTLNQICLLMDSGAKSNGSTAKMTSSVQLNQALPRWLMSLPPEWCQNSPTLRQIETIQRLEKLLSKVTETQ